MRPPVYPEAITEEWRCDARFHVVTCVHPGCRNEITVKVGAKRKAPRILDNIVRNRGWTAKPKKNRYLCPRHNQ